MASQDTAANKVVLPPSCNSHHPQRHRYRAQDDASSATAAVSFGPWGADDADNFVEFRPATFCCSVSSSSSTEQPPPQSYRKSAKDWAASSTSITTDQVGSWCESVETPIACVFPARQVAPNCPPPPEYKVLQDQETVKKIALVISGPGKGNLDPISLLQGTSLLATSPPTVVSCSIGGQTTSPRRGSTLRQRKINNVVARVLHAKVCQGFADNGPGAHMAALRGQDDRTPLSGDTLTGHHGGSSVGGKPKEDGARGSDTSASLHLQHEDVRGQHPTSVCSTTAVFVRSKQWGQRHPDRAQPQRQPLKDSSSFLGFHQVSLMGGKRPRPPTACEKIKYEQAGSKRSAATKMVRIAQSPHLRHCDTRRTNGKAECAAEDNQPHSREGKRVKSPASVANQRQHQGIGGLVQGEKARKNPPSGVSANLATTPWKGISLETSSPRVRNTTSREWKTTHSPAADRKLRPDNTQRHLYPCQAPRWFAAAEEDDEKKGGLLGTAESDPLPASLETRALATVTTKGGKSSASGLAAPIAQPVEGVTQPLSVVAVWSRPSSQGETARKDESPPRADAVSPRAVRSSGDTAEGLTAVGSDCQELSRPQHSKTPDCRETGPTEAPLERGAVCRKINVIGHNSSSTSNQNHETNRRGARTRVRPASAGLLYFRAHLNRDGGEVVPPQRRGAKGVIGRKSDAYPEPFSPKREKNAVFWEPSTPESPPAGDTTLNKTVGAAGGNSGQLSVAVATASEERDREEERGGDNAIYARNTLNSSSSALFSTTGTATKNGGGHTFGLTTPPTSTPPNDDAIEQDIRNPWNVLMAAPPSNILRPPPRVEKPIAATADCADLGVQGVGRVLLTGRPRRPSSGRTSLQFPAAVAVTAAPAHDENGDSPPSPCRDGGRPTPSAATCEAEKNITTAARLSTLEMISAMANVSPLAPPPECVTGLEIRIRARQTRRPSSASPRCLRTATTATASRGLIDRCDLYSQEIPPRVAAHNQPCARSTTGGTFRGSPAPCKPSITLFSRSGSEREATDQNQRRKVVAASRLIVEETRGGDGGFGASGVERPRPGCCVDDLQLYLKDPGCCREQYRGNTDVRPDRISPGRYRSGGEEGGGGGGSFAEGFGGEKPLMSTPFSRYVYRSICDRNRLRNPEPGTPRPKQNVLATSPGRPCTATMAQPSTPYQYIEQNSQAFLRAILAGVSKKRIEMRKNSLLDSTAVDREGSQQHATSKAAVSNS